MKLMNNTKVYLAETSWLNKKESYDLALSLITEKRKEKALKYIDVDKRKEAILGELLLKYALKINGIEKDLSDLVINDHGKPSFKDSDIYFNIAHSNGFVLVAISETEVGCDIELVRKRKSNIAERYFTKPEAALVKDEFDFTRLWTLKESILKNIGTGLDTPLAAYDFSDKLNDNRFNKTFDGKKYYFSVEQIPDFYISVCSTNENIDSIKNVNHLELLVTIN